MGSNPWSPTSVLKDCSKGICSIYCPQWCYIIFSPPPPPIILGDDTDDDDSSSGFQFSPLIVAVIGILASTFILVTYYTIISRFFNHRGRINDPTSQLEEESEAVNNELGQVSSSSSGLDESLIKSITVYKYQTGGGLVEGSDCSVCLSEFQENESLRLLPKCNHAFHLPCIDPWLKDHSSCPLCRSIITCSEPVMMEAPTSMNINSMEYQQRSDDVVVVIQSNSSQQSSMREVVISFGAEVLPKRAIEEGAHDDDGENVDQQGLNMSQRVSVADILNCNEDDV